MPKKTRSSVSHVQSTRTFNAFPTAYRGSAPNTTHALADIFQVPIHKDILIPTTEALPPPLPYSWEFCSANTFVCNDGAVSAQSLREKVMDMVRKSPADISCHSEWQFTGTCYPQQVKTVFQVSIFNNETKARRKNSCLLEMQLQEGDRVAFQGLCSYIQSQANLAYAFADDWGFDEVEVDSNWDTGYQHRSFAPPPLPTSVLAKMEQIKMATLPFMDTSKNCMVDILMENASSAFIDVRRNGWRELAQATEDENTAEALLQTSVNDKECISLGASVLREDSSTCELTADTQRCVLKTLLNLALTRDPDARRKISALKAEISKLAEAFDKNSVEARSTAAQLIQSLA